jgi:hypothetical protein
MPEVVRRHTPIRRLEQLFHKSKDDGLSAPYRDRLSESEKARDVRTGIPVE